MRTVLKSLFIVPALAAAGTSAAAQEPNFGRALAMTGSELVIGQPVNWYGPGVVYVYGPSEAGLWSERSRLMASDSARMDDFGRSLAVEGNTLIVGAPRKRDGGGVAYAFERDSPAGTWRQVAVIEPPAGEDHPEFARAIAISGDDLLIGSPEAETTGTVLHYRRAGGAWTLHRVLRPAAPAEVRGFGEAISQDGDLLLIGAPGSGSGVGSVFASSRQSDGEWSEPRPIPVSTAAERAGVGSAVLLDGERAFVGAPGAATVFSFVLDDEGAWRSTGDFGPPDEPRGAQFGAAMAVADGELWVGAPGVNGRVGRVYQFGVDPQGGWQSPRTLDADSADGTSWPFQFGYSLASAGDQVAVGMPQRDFGEGRVQVMARQGQGWGQVQLLEGRIFALGGTLTSGERCDTGRIADFPCANIELVSHMPVSALGGERGVWVNDVWGWTDPETGRDYALVARRDGASFVDVTDPAAPRLVGNLPRTTGSPPSVWRDIKVANDHAYIVADGADAHGMQVFDLTRLRAVTGDPAVFEPDATYHEFHSAHNVVADTASGYLYVVGANSGGETCGGGLHMVDAREPTNPSFAGCYNDREGANNTGYTHDAQCVTYRGPDTRYHGRQICVGSNESEINIADVTDKSNPVTVGRNSYPNVAYAHQGWFDDEQRYFYMNDELDELAGTVAGTRTIVWDLTELDDPIVARQYIGPVRSSDHNLFVRGDRMYQSNYGGGFRVLDISDRTNPVEIAFFDSAPYNDDEPGHSATQSGAWSNYPFFEDGIVVFTSVREGLFIVRVQQTRPIS